MRAFVAGNVTIDETISVGEFPSLGASILGSAAGFDLGGKGANQAVVLGRCGVQTTLVAAIGGGSRGRVIRELLSGEPLDARLVEMAQRASDVSIILVLPDGNNAIVTTTDSADNLSGAAVTEALSSATEGDLLLLQGNLSASATRQILEFARAIGLRTVLNPSPVRPYFNELWPLVDLVFMNEGEAAALTGLTGKDAAAALLTMGVKQVVLTLGAGGAVLFEDDRDVTVEATSVAVVDTTGAGDTFTGVALASAIRRGSAIDRRALQDAAEAAALTVSRRGTRSAFPSVAEAAAILTKARSS